MPKVGIAIVHYHAEELLRQCLERLKASDVEDFKAIIVDCDSLDGLEHLVENDERFQLITPGNNIGFAAGTNLAFQNLSKDTPFLLSLNPDVLVGQETISLICRLLEEDPELGAATCKLLLPSGSIDPACRRSNPTLFSALSKQIGLQRIFQKNRLFGRYNLTHLDPDTPHDIDSGTGAFLLIRREALDAIGGMFDEQFFLYGEDLDLCRRIREAGYRIHYFPGARAVHVKGSGRIRPFPITVQFYKAMWVYYRKWGRYRSNPFVLLLLLFALIVLGSGEIVRNTAKSVFVKIRKSIQQ